MEQSDEVLSRSLDTDSFLVNLNISSAEFGALTSSPGSLGNITPPIDSPLFDSSMMSQSLKTDVLHIPPILQRAMSTSPRLEHSADSQPALDEKCTTEEDLFFPCFIDSSQDVALDSTLPINRQSIQDRVIQSLANSNPARVGRNSSLTSGRFVKSSYNSDTGNTMNESTRSGFFGSGKLGFFSRNSSVVSIQRKKPTTMRMDSDISTSSSVGYANYMFGSAIFGSPSKRSINSAKVNIVMDSQSIYPSLGSLFSEVNQTFGHVNACNGSLVEMVTANGHVSSSHQDLASPPGLDSLDQSMRIYPDSPESEDAVLQRSVSLPSRYAYHSAPKGKGKSKDVDEVVDEEICDELTDLKTTLAGIIPTKKKWQQTMPDLVEGPESETLTMHSTTGRQLAAAALAIIKGDFTSVGLSDGKSMTEELDAKVESKRYMKNLLVLCAVFFFIFTAYLSLRNLQSSLNDIAGLGMYSLSCVYAFLFLGSIFTTTIVQRLRPKFSMLASLIGFLIYNLANFYPRFYTLIPASCVVGFCLAIIWTSHATYLANIASSYADLTGSTAQNVMSRFHGIFFAFFQMSQIVGGLLSSLLLTKPPGLYPSSTNYTGNFSGEAHNFSLLTFPVADVIYNISASPDNFTNSAGHLFCGVDYCPETGAVTKSKSNVDRQTILLLMGIFMACSLVGVLILLFFLDPLEGTMKKSHANIKDQMSAVFRFFVSFKVICLMPLMFYTLLQVSFMFGEYSKAYVTCALGVHMVGYLMVCLSVSAGIFAYLMGVLQKYVGRAVLILSATVIQFGLLVGLLFWRPSSDTLIIFFIVAALWGASDGVLATQLISLIGTLFSSTKEPAFAAYKMSQSTSAFAMFITGPYLCTRTKIFTLLVGVVVAIIGYSMLEIRLKLEGSKNDKENATVTTDSIEKKEIPPSVDESYETKEIPSQATEFSENKEMLPDFDQSSNENDKTIKA